MKKAANQRISPPKWVRYIFSFGLAGISLFILYRLIQGNFNELKSAVWEIKIIPLLASLPIFVLTAFISSVIWGQMMDAFGVHKDWKIHSFIYLSTAFAGRIPGGIWNVVGRITWYDRIGVPKRITSFVSAMQWFILLWSGSLIIFISLPFLVGYQNKIYPMVIPIMISGGILHPKILDFIMSKIFQIDDNNRPNYKKVLMWLIGYIFIWILGGGILYIIVSSIQPVKLSTLVLSISAWCVGGVSGNLVTFLPSGFGLSEVGISLILSLQIPSAVAVISALIMRVLFTIYEFFVSVISFLIFTQTERIKMQQKT